MEVILGYVSIAVIAFVLGCIIRGSTKVKYIGNLIADDTDPDGTYLYLELNCKPEEVLDKKYVTLRVNRKGYFHS